MKGIKKAIDKETNDSIEKINKQISNITSQLKKDK